jgi:pyrimidine-specific ribonucleoside hydrolase
VTNVATLLDLHPELQARIERVVMVAGRRPGQRFYPRRDDGTVPEPPPGAAHRDFNFELDPEAMAVVLASEVPLVFAPWEVSSWVWIRRADLEGLADAGETGAFVAEACGSWLDLWQERFGVDGFNPFDTLAVGYLSSPELFETMDVTVWIEERPDDREPPGSGVTKPYLLVDQERAGGRRATYCVRPGAAFVDQLLERLAGS